MADTTQNKFLSETQDDAPGRSRTLGAADGASGGASSASSAPAQGHLLLCSCDKTMSVDAGLIASALGIDAAPPVFDQLCRAQMPGFEKALAAGGPVMVACTQEAPLFSEVAGLAGAAEPTFVNIRERAGWCGKGRDASAKMAGLLAEATVEARPAETMAIESEGVCLVYGSGQAAIDAAQRLAGRLSPTVVLHDVGDAQPDARGDVPVFKGRIAKAAGALGAFEVVVDGYAPMVPSSRDALAFMMPRNGAASRCDIIMDMSGGDPLLADAERRDGYFRVDMRAPGALERALFDAADLVGTFEKPLYVRYDAGICAHARSGKVGCRMCLEACPVGAIAPDGEQIVVDQTVCGGCGTCHATCPTGAVAYAYPARDDTVARIQVLLGTYAEAGGTAPVLLIHEQEHGGALIAALARYGDGLAPNVLPLSLYTATQVGHDVLAHALAAGAHHVVVLASEQKRGELDAAAREIELMNALLAGMGAGMGDAGSPGARVHLVVADDPDALTEALAGLAEVPSMLAASEGAPAPSAGKRENARVAITQLHAMARTAGAQQAGGGSIDVIPLPDAAPYGQIHINANGCTLCLACVSVCPANALADNAERPEVSFTEAACVQCGLCRATCPEQVITLEPRYNFSPSALSPTVLHGEEPFECISCGKPFGTKSTIQRVMDTLAGKHPMFADSAQARVMQMCEDCRVIAMSEMETPLAVGERPKVRTTADYLAEQAEAAT
ncbi:MAG: 4Fe-4S binding protein, partial [Pseudomonadota bacterium]